MDFSFENRGVFFGGEQFEAGLSVEFVFYVMLRGGVGSAFKKVGI